MCVILRGAQAGSSPPQEAWLEQGSSWLVCVPLTLDDCFWFWPMGDTVRAIFLTIPRLQNSGSVMRPLVRQVEFRAVFIM